MAQVYERNLVRGSSDPFMGRYGLVKRTTEFIARNDTMGTRVTFGTYKNIIEKNVIRIRLPVGRHVDSDIGYKSYFFYLFLFHKDRVVIPVTSATTTISLQGVLCTHTHTTYRF